MGGCQVLGFAMECLHTPETHTLSVMSGASDYAVKPNQFPVFCLMTAIIINLKQVNIL